MLSNAYFPAKFRFDTAENEPAKNLQILLIFPILRGPRSRGARRPVDEDRLAACSGRDVLFFAVAFERRTSRDTLFLPWDSGVVAPSQ